MAGVWRGRSEASVGQENARGVRMARLQPGFPRNLPSACATNGRPARVLVFRSLVPGAASRAAKTRGQLAFGGSEGAVGFRGGSQHSSHDRTGWIENCEGMIDPHRTAVDYRGRSRRSLADRGRLVTAGSIAHAARSRSARKRWPLLDGVLASSVRGPAAGQGPRTRRVFREFAGVGIRG